MRGHLLYTKAFQEREGIDVWAVDVTGLTLVPDNTTDWPDEEDAWWVSWDADVTPDRLQLIEPAALPSPGI